MEPVQIARREALFEGWKEARMAYDRLAQDVHRNMVDAFAALPAHQPDGVLERNDEVVLAFTGSPIAFFNQVVPVEAPLTAAGLEAAVHVARRTGISWVLHLRDGVDDACVPVATDLGLVEEAPYFYPAMVLTDLPRPEPPPEGLEIRTVTDVVSFDEHLEAGADPGTDRTWLGAGVMHDPCAVLLTGIVDGAPVARSMSYRTGAVVGVFNVGVRDDMRRHGFGWAMTLAAIRAAAGDECTTAALQSSEMGYPVYSSHGFRTVFDYRCFRAAALAPLRAAASR